MAYAEGTDVKVEKSMSEIVALVKKSGATRVAQWEEPDRLTIQFDMENRMVRFRVLLPDWKAMPEFNGRRERLDQARRQALAEQRHRQRARALLLVIKAKIESVESGVETFEEAFLSNVVMANGQTVYERIAEPVALEYASGVASVLLLGGPGR